MPYYGGGNDLASYASQRDRSMQEAFQFAMQMLADMKRRKGDEAWRGEQMDFQRGRAESADARAARIDAENANLNKVRIAEAEARLKALLNPPPPAPVKKTADEIKYENIVKTWGEGSPEAKAFLTGIRPDKPTPKKEDAFSRLDAALAAGQISQAEHAKRKKDLLLGGGKGKPNYKQVIYNQAIARGFDKMTAAAWAEDPYNYSDDIQKALLKPVVKQPTGKNPPGPKARAFRFSDGKAVPKNARVLPDQKGKWYANVGGRPVEVFEQ